jgi:hypothetical protein
MEQHPEQEASSDRDRDSNGLSPVGKARDAFLRLQIEMVGGSSGKRRLALLGLGSLLALTMNVKGAGAHGQTPNAWSSSGCGSACSGGCCCWPCQHCC